MTLPAEADVVVVGGGMAGASVAWELCRRDASVVLLEQETGPGMHSTGRSAAVLTETTGPPVVRDLAAASRAFLRDPPAGFCDVPLTSPRAVLWVGTADQEERLRARAAEWASRARRIESLGSAETRTIVPLLRNEYARWAVLEPDGLDIDVDAVLRGYLGGLRRHGGVVATSAPVVALERRSHRWRVETPSGSVLAAALVNAAGAWADTVAALAGGPGLGLQPTRRTAFVFPAPAGADTGSWPLVMDADERFYLKPEAGLLLASPCDETPCEPCDARPDELDVALGVERIEAAFDLEVRGVRATWAGLRTFAADRAPVAGPDPELPGFVWLAGQGGYGIKTAPALATVTAAMVLDEAPSADAAEWLPAISPGRLRPNAGRG